MANYCLTVSNCQYYLEIECSIIEEPYLTCPLNLLLFNIIQIMHGNSTVIITANYFNLLGYSIELDSMVTGVIHCIYLYILIILHDFAIHVLYGINFSFIHYTVCYVNRRFKWHCLCISCTSMESV